MENRDTLGFKTGSNPIFRAPHGEFNFPSQQNFLREVWGVGEKNVWETQDFVAQSYCGLTKLH
ncbi:MAG: hypothetical protein A2887_01015 [Alphaproteobacteria bacterium RIFCSPLOWO2_01_FULL_40_26]|nr:MAG: hypothetical protein A3D15_04250 [Alphaproteobacteria bacterium RIFCSPHIGHO2_02_FULL_40_34]OFW85901.1 MAG: hypothetical protein A2794_00665 [Alphaproteobacteria bacterium RIFCSPHIGHO2_01_FULL_40_8]OFW95051.1 MAG: hypothetical protein A2887_01015 [Alphaproteobacteria bacterium RIFCSPLOWO2_01_FULL_40_26]OFX09866.1 MAG: hypothetical protein A3H30_02600 [Alphaproteobacteria bacterium RIFCSPLOWO2_02_FULL_40_19]OFX11364.1 MAG: hypothetical protein A3G22_03245 [Alphaproteobacteria bacterium RI